VSVARGLLAAVLALACGACATLSPAQRVRVEAIASAARSTQLTCDRADACAQPSSLHALADRARAESSASTPRHYALMLDRGADAMLARIDLIRSATRSIDLQTYIFEEDDAGRLVLDEQLAAARRGVHVRLLVDQLSAFQSVETLAALAGAHVDFAIRIYNPVLGRARINYPQYLLASACCWHALNQRMHTKLLLVDDAVGISGGRNYADDYYDWSADFNFLDRDVLVAGPVAQAMARNFDDFWNSPRSRPAEQLADVGRRILRGGVPALAPAPDENPARVAAMASAAGDPALVRERLTDHAIAVGAVDYLADRPDKHNEGHNGIGDASHGLRELIDGAQHEVLLQTPYLVLSKPAQRLFRSLHRRASAPHVIISTNSLASTDSFITYALSYKYKRRYLRDFGFDIHEFKPFPGDVPMDQPAAPPPVPVSAQAPATATGPATAAPPPSRQRLRRSGSVLPHYRAPLETEYGALAARRNLERVPLQRAGVRASLHAKSLVVDSRIAVIGTHNFDPRGDRYNTESAVVIADPAFAQALEASIRRDVAPANSWAIAPRAKAPVFSGLEYSLAKLSERLPIFDLWPVRYATSYEFEPGPQCPAPLAPDDPGFGACYRPVGDFPEVNIGLKAILTRIFTAFGAGFAPVL
jgi:phosphatidylserine/phosphatidylglycerophosphate/cardiolipin synthase-like enzyme